MYRALVALAFASLPLIAQTPCANTPAYSPCEFTFDLTDQDAAAHPNPYLTARLHIEFRSPRYQTLLMPAFWDGGRRIVVRFTPTEPGEWISRVTSNLGAPGRSNRAPSPPPPPKPPASSIPANVHHWAWTRTPSRTCGWATPATASCPRRQRSSAPLWILAPARNSTISADWWSSPKPARAFPPPTAPTPPSSAPSTSASAT